MNAKKVKKLKKLFQEIHGRVPTQSPVYNMKREVVEPNEWRQFKKKYSNLNTFAKSKG